MFTFDHRARTFERAEKVGVAVHIGNDKTESGRSWKFRAGQELQRGGVLVPAAILFCLTLAGRLVEERYRVNIREDSNRNTAYSREVNALRQVSAIDPADSHNSGKNLSRCFHRDSRGEDKTDNSVFRGLRSVLF